MELPWLEVEHQSTVAAGTSAGISILHTDGGAGRDSSFVPVSEATMVAQGREQPLRAYTGFHLRDNRWYQGLVRIDLSRLPPGASVSEATFYAGLGSIARPGSAGTFRCHRMLRPWSAERASWTTAGAGADAAWNGLRAGVDFEVQPFATWTAAALDASRPGGSILRVPGFGQMARNWRDSPETNHGFLLLFDGPARECRVQLANVTTWAGLLDTGDAVRFVPNLPLLRRVAALGADDLATARIVLPVSPLAPVELSLYHLPDTTSEGNLQPARFIQRLSVQPEGGGGAMMDLVVPISDVVKEWMRGSSERPRLEIRAESGGPMLLGAGQPVSSTLSLDLITDPAPSPFPRPRVLRSGAYVTQKDGHLHYDGRRLRLWGVVGQPNVDRLARLGFNAERVWSPNTGSSDNPRPLYTRESVRQGVFAPSTPGDGSVIDLADRHMAELKDAGFFVSLAALTDSVPVALLAGDDSFVAGAPQDADWAAWKAAVTSAPSKSRHFVYVDERLQRARLQHARNLLTHVNPYTGKPYGAEEHIAIYEVFNENGFVKAVLDGEADTWPAYFRGGLDARWNAWLIERYGSSDRVREAWGALDTGESLEGGSVELAPLSTQTDNHPARRGEDVVRFLVELADAFHQAFRAHCRSLFPTGIGVNVAPFSFDTQYRPHLAWSYMQSLGDVHSFGMYYWDLRSALEKPPAAYVLDNSTVAGKPTMIYETNHGRPGPFRAEYPYRLAALASWQDWDVVFWHYWGPAGGDQPLDYLTGTVPPPSTAHYWTSVHHELDPVMNSAMALSGRIFVESRLPPAPDPAIITMTADSIFQASPFPPPIVREWTFSRGARLRFEPAMTGAPYADGKPLPNVAEPRQSASQSGPMIQWAWASSRMTIDAPSVKVFVGPRPAFLTFADGSRLDQISAPWMSFAVMSADGLPLALPHANRTFWMAGVADARNTGFSFAGSLSNSPAEQARAVLNPGTAPVVVDPVGFRFLFPNVVERGEQIEFDFAFRPMRSRSLSSSEPPEQIPPTPLLSSVRVDTWGPKTDESRLGAPTTLGALRADTPEKLDITSVDLEWLLPGLAKAASGQGELAARFAAARQATNSAPASTPPPRELTVALGRVSLASPWGEGDVILHFAGGALDGAEATLFTAPSFPRALTLLEERFGRAENVTREDQAGASRAFWPARDGRPAITLSDNQGTMHLTVNVP